MKKACTRLQLCRKHGCHTVLQIHGPLSSLLALQTDIIIRYLLWNRYTKVLSLWRAHRLFTGLITQCVHNKLLCTIIQLNCLLNSKIWEANCRLYAVIYSQSFVQQPNLNYHTLEMCSVCQLITADSQKPHAQSRYNGVLLWLHLFTSRPYNHD